jgi:hypothetical protein
MQGSISVQAPAFRELLGCTGRVPARPSFAVTVPAENRSEVLPISSHLLPSDTG